MRDIFEEHKLLVVCGFLSVFLLLTFSIMQYYGSDVLKLESKWLAISGVPLLVALFGGGYITRFKGFGLELDTKLKSPVKGVTFKAVDVATRLQGDDKAGINYLNNLSEDETKQIKVLNFITGKQDYYAEWAVKEYLVRLKYLEYLAVTKETGEFVCAVPVKKLKPDNDQINVEYYDDDKVSNFIEAIERNNAVKTYRNACITLTIKQNETLIAALKKLRENNTDKAAVVNSKKVFTGILTEREIEHRIADDVLSTQRSTRTT